MSSSELIDRDVVLTTTCLCKTYETSRGSRIELLRGLSFKVRLGECVVLVGRNGSGKSTLLRIIAGLESPTSGFVRLNPSSLDVAYLAQGVGEYAGRDLTVCEQVNLGRLRQAQVDAPRWSLSGPRAHLRAANLVRRLGMGIEHMLDEFVRNLSGGQMQAVMLASIIGATPPALILLDEHSSALDQVARDAIADLLQDCLTSRATSLVMVTHDQELLRRMPAKVIELCLPLYSFQGTGEQFPKEASLDA